MRIQERYLTGIALVLAASSTVLAAEPRVASGSVAKGPGQVVRGPRSSAPPSIPPPAPGTIQRGAPEVEDGLVIAAEQLIETRIPSGAPQASGDFTLVRDSVIPVPAGFSSTVNEPSVGSQAQALFMTGNWYASASTDNGGTFSYLSPYSTFPASPAAFSAGFCCDQRVMQDPSRDLIFWYLQYVKNGSTASSTNGVRIAMAHGQDGVATNTWQYHDFTPADFGFAAGAWLDFPHLQVSANYLYFTSNLFSTTTDTFVGAVIGRIPLAALASNSPFTMNTFVVTGSYGSIAPVSGATTTMYFGSRSSSNGIKVLVWPETATSPTVSDVVGLATTTSAVYACPGPDGRDPCTRANGRMQTGWITASELGFMWTSSQDGGAHPFPYVRTVILDPSSQGVISQPDIFSTSNAFLYPAVAVNGRGHMGGVVDALGGALFPTVLAIVRDDLSPDVAANGWQTFTVASSTHGTAGLWGDYNGVVAHEAYPNTWIGVGHVQNGGSTNTFSQPRNFWFMRERDIPPGGSQTATVTFELATTTANESAAVVEPTVRLTTSDGGPLVVPASVWYATSDGTAMMNQDYTATSGTLTFAAGTQSGDTRLAPVAILDDARDEADERFSISLSSPSNASLGSQTTHTITILDNDPPALDTVGLYDGENAAAYLRNANSSGFADLAFGFGVPGMTALTGDWDGDGVDSIGAYDPVGSTFFLRNTNSSGFADIAFAFGPGGAGWRPLAGDWDGDGIDSIGLYDPAGGVFYLRNRNSTGFADLSVSFGPGALGWLPLGGDWNGDGIDSVALYDPVGGAFYLRNSNISGFADVAFGFGGGGGGWLPIDGDWNADGVDTVGLYVPSSGAFYLRNSNTTGFADVAFAFGPAGHRWLALSGDFDGH